MAISAKMLQYRGAYENFRPSVLLPGQFAVVLSGDPNTTTGKAVYMCFETGKATRILADGDVVSGGGVSDAQIAEAVENYLANNPIEYELPIANANTLGGVKPVAKISSMTQAVGVDAEGKLFTAPGGSSGSVSWNDITDKPFYEAPTLIEYDWQNEYTDLVAMPEGGWCAYLAKISDAGYTIEDLVGKTLSVTMAQLGQEVSQNVELTENTFSPLSENTFMISEFVFVVNEDSFSLEDTLGIPIVLTRGVWGMHGWAEDSQLIIKHLAILAGEGKPISDDLLPENVVKAVGAPTNILNVKISYGSSSDEYVFDKTFDEIKQAFYNGAYIIATFERQMFFGAYHLVEILDYYAYFVKMKAGPKNLVENRSVSHRPTGDNIQTIGYDCLVLYDDNTVARFNDSDGQGSPVMEELYLNYNEVSGTYTFGLEEFYDIWKDGRYDKPIYLTYHKYNSATGKSLYKKFRDDSGSGFSCTFIEDGKYYMEYLEIKSATEILSTKIELGGGGSTSAEGVAF